ncbi:MAG: transcription antiterminator, partial [Erysipelotrichaceae bacterium]|nr:transcription antiterminator [Erysipelotrichaceae bacterium]
FLGVSRPRIKSLVKDINAQLKDHGAQIEGKTGRGNGYSLVIEDINRYEEYIHKILPEEMLEEKELFFNTDARVNYITQRLLQSDDFIKAEDLTDELAVSRNQFSKDMKIVRSRLSKVGIKVQQKPYYGLKIEANELTVRQALAKLQSEKLFSSTYSATYSDDKNDNIVLAQLKTIIINECERFDYNLMDVTCENLVTHLYVAIKRAEKKYQVQFSEDERKSIEQEKEFDLAKAIIFDIQSYLGVVLPRNEIYYCAIHLCSKKALDSEYVVNPEIQKLVQDMLEYLDSVKQTSFRTDFRLAMRLSLHMVPFVSRVRYRLELKNPLLEEIKTRYIQAFECASICADFLNRRLDCTLSEHEISYIALHFQISFNDQKSGNRKNILVICSTGRGSAALLKIRIKQQYEKYIDNITMADYLSVGRMDLSQFDYIFSTVPLKDIKRPYLLISHFLDSDDDEKITSMLEGGPDSFYGYFVKDYFMSHIKASSKEEAIRQMVDNIRKHRLLDEKFYENVIKRENLANTCFARGIAIPHPYEIMTDDTFVAVGILDRSIQWNDEDRVRLILLCSFSGGFAKDNEAFFEKLSKIISSENTVRELTHAEDYQT